jgi:hypothetical protein
MSSFTENLYLKRQIQKLQEENNNLRAILEANKKDPEDPIQRRYLELKNKGETTFHESDPFARHLEAKLNDDLESATSYDGETVTDALNIQGGTGWYWLKRLRNGNYRLAPSMH